MPAAARVLIVEDESFARTMLVSTLTALGMNVVGACASAADALSASHESEPDVALLDLDLGPGPSGIDLAYALRERMPRLGIVLLTSYTDPRLKHPGERALPRGSRFLVKARLEALHVLRETILRARHDPLGATAAPATRGALTTNQIEVLRLVAAGRSNAEIAEQQGVGEKAIERTIQRVLEVLAIDRGSGNPRVLAARAYVELSGKTLPAV